MVGDYIWIGGVSEDSVIHTLSIDKGMKDIEYVKEDDKFLEIILHSVLRNTRVGFVHIMYEWIQHTECMEHRTPIFYLDGKFHEDILRNTYLRLGVIVFKIRR